MEAETTSLRSLEDFDGALSKIEENFTMQDLPEEYTSMPEFRSAVLKELFPVFGSCNILKLRKSYSKTNCIVWIVMQLQEHFIYAVIFHLFWTDEKKGLSMHKKLEEVDVGWIKAHNPKTLNEFRDFVESNECFHYSLTDETSRGIELPCFERFLSKVSEHPHHPQQQHEKHSVSKPHRHHHHRPQTPPERPLREKYRTYERTHHRSHRPSPRHRPARESVQKERHSKRKQQKRKQRSHRLVETVYTSSEEDPLGARKKETNDQRWNDVLVRKKPSHRDPSF